MNKKKIAALIFCSALLLPVLTGCGAGNVVSEAGKDISETISRIDSDTKSTVSRVESFLEGDNSGHVDDDRSGIIDNNSDLESELSASTRD